MDCSWKPFDKMNYKQLMGAMDYSFLCAYAVGMYLSPFPIAQSGVIGERLPIRLYLTVGMLTSGLFTCLFGLGYVYNIHSLGFYIFVQVANGLVQTTGWPSLVTCIGNWFGKGRRGLIMGLWNSHTSVGNILGSLIAGYWVSSNWGLSFIVPGLIIAAMGVICFLFLIEHPNDLKSMYAENSCPGKSVPTKSLNGINGHTEVYLQFKDNKTQSYDTELLLPRESVCVPVQPVVVVKRESEPSAISFMGALRIPGVIEFSLCLLFAKLVSYTFLFWLPLYITKAAHLDAKKAGDLSTLFDVGGIVGGILAGVISDKLGKRATTCAVMLLLAAPTLYGFSMISEFGLGPTIGMLLVCGSLVNGPYSLITTAVSADLGTHKSLKGNARALSTVTAIIDGTGSVGAALGPLLAGLLSAGGWDQVFYMLMAADFLALLLLLRLVTKELVSTKSRPISAVDTTMYNNMTEFNINYNMQCLYQSQHGRRFTKEKSRNKYLTFMQIKWNLPAKLFLSSCRNTNLSLLDSSGAMVSIDPTMPHNTERSPYRVVPMTGGQLAEKPTFHALSSDKEELFQNVLTQVAEQFSRAFKINELKTEVTNRLAMLEKRVELEGMKVVEIEKCRNDIKKLREEMASRNNSNFLEDNKKLTPRRDVPSYPKYMLSQQTIDALKKPAFDVWLWEANEYHLSKETVEALRLPSFDAWQWEPNEMLSCLEHMYHDLGLVKDFNINPITLKRWLLCIHDNYKNNPFHNFRHCFCVTQMMYSMICLCSLQERFTQVDILILMTAAVCHDLDHPGFNNTYQINARTELAVRYNDISPLENHHCAVAFQIFSQPDCNIFSNFDPEAFKQIRQGTITLILATDMARHGEILDSFKQKVDSFDYTDEEHVTCLKMVLIKCCDISNEVRPMEVAEPWVDCLLEEYFMQSDREKAEGLPVAPFMDREKVTKPTAQIGFIKFVLIPMFETVMKVNMQNSDDSDGKGQTQQNLFPQIEEAMVQPLRESRDRYEELKQIDDAMNEVQKKKSENLTMGGKKK
ncbi:hypothetical protein L3Q82_017816 [Scortum barcoo]|uniref:Uncharacterized protein n=1 Tax=Scortum barcoo TaxID=214431 RepID=A0ACB8VLS9_9TELE|nr:hypothetical protein L3Q82_017816 [Scortum barcoo]